MVSGVVQLHQGVPWCKWLPWYKCTTPKTVVHFTTIVPFYSHGKLYHGFWSGTTLPRYYHSTTDYHGTIVPPRRPLKAMVHFTVVVSRANVAWFSWWFNCSMVVRCYNWLPWYYCTTPKSMVPFTMVLPLEMYHGFRVVTFVHCITVVQLLTSWVRR
jgi:hypothetical protein